MSRWLVGFACALGLIGLATGARAETPRFGAGPAIDDAPPVMALTLLDGWRNRAETLEHRLTVPRGSLRSEPEQPGESLTSTVERVWSQVRAYRLPGGAEVIVRGQF
jgi:hypothetical protein